MFCRGSFTVLKTYIRANSSLLVLLNAAQLDRQLQKREADDAPAPKARRQCCANFSMYICTLRFCHLDNGKWFHARLKPSAPAIELKISPELLEGVYLNIKKICRWQMLNSRDRWCFCWPGTAENVQISTRKKPHRHRPPKALGRPATVFYVDSMGCTLTEK